MMKLYYLVCVDAINKASNKSPDGWKPTVILYLSTFLGLLFMAVVIILEKNVPSFEYSVFSSDIMENDVCQKTNAILMFFVPAAIINYFLILYKNRYEKLLKKYQHGHGMYIINFMVFSIFFVLIAIFI